MPFDKASTTIHNSNKLSHNCKVNGHGFSSRSYRFHRSSVTVNCAFLTILVSFAYFIILSPPPAPSKCTFPPRGKPAAIVTLQNMLKNSLHQTDPPPPTHPQRLHFSSPCFTNYLKCHFYSISSNNHRWQLIHSALGPTFLSVVTSRLPLLICMCTESKTCIFIHVFSDCNNTNTRINYYTYFTVHSFITVQ